MAEGINANVSLRRNVVASIGKPGTIGKGDPGTGIVDIEPAGQSADGNIYRIYLSDGTSYDFTAPKGDTGNPGAVGVTPNLQIGEVTTLDAGADATASITGTAENPLLNLGIPKGAVGVGSFRVVVDIDSETGAFTANKTFAEILAAYNAGMLPYVFAYETPDRLYSLRTVADDQFEFGCAYSRGENELVDSGFYINANGVYDTGVAVTIPTVDDVLAALPTWTGGSY